MSELKTLKDLKFDYCGSSDFEHNVDIDNDEIRDILKRNAINWIKHWRKLREDIRKEMRAELPKDIFKPRFENINEIYEGKISSFKHVFNITEEDLR